MKPYLALALCALFLGLGCDDGAPATQEDTTVMDTAVAEDTGTVDTGSDEETSVCGSFNYCLDEFDRPNSGFCEAEQRCNRTTGCCEEPFRCTDDASCEDNLTVSEVSRRCVDANVACVCDVTTGLCNSFLCSGDSDCEAGELCADGACVAVPAEAGLEARIITPSRALAPGETLTLEVVAVDPSNPSVVVRDVAFAFSGNADLVATVDPSTGAVAAVAEGNVTFTATVAANSSDPGDRVDFSVLAEPTGAAFSVYVYDETARSAVADGVTVYITDSTGATTSETTAGGWISVSTAPSYPVSVSVFDPSYTYVTITSVEPTGSETSVSLFLPLAPITRAVIAEDENTGELTYDLLGVGVVRGKPLYDLVAVKGEIDVALSGLSLSSSLFELDLNLIIGPEVPQELPESSPIPVDGPVDIPSGVTLGLNGEPIVEFYNTVGTPPVRTLWTVGGKVSLFENPNLFVDVADNLDSQDIAGVVAAILPFFRNFYSGVVRDIALSSGDVIDQDTLLSLPTNLQTELPITEVPVANGVELDLALVIGGTIIPGQGFLPLGITAGVGHTDPATGESTGEFDGDPSTDAKDPIELTLSPMHSGLEVGGRYSVVAAALSSDDSQGVRTTGIVARYGAGDAIAPVTTLPRPQLPKLPENSSYDDASRTVTVDLGTETPTMVRVIMSGSDNNRWVVFAPSDVTSIVLPDPNAIAGVADRADKDISLSTLTVADAVSYDELLRFSGPRLVDLIDIVSDFTVYQVRK